MLSFLRPEPEQQPKVWLKRCMVDASCLPLQLSKVAMNLHSRSRVPQRIKQEVLLDAHFGGFGKTEPRLIQEIAEFTWETGVLLDPLYSAKALHAMRSRVEKGLHNGQRVGLIHTGGLTAWYGKWTEVLSIKNPDSTKPGLSD